MHSNSHTTGVIVNMSIWDRRHVNMHVSMSSLDYCRLQSAIVCLVCLYIHYIMYIWSVCSHFIDTDCGVILCVLVVAINRGREDDLPNPLDRHGARNQEGPQQQRQQQRQREGAEEQDRVSDYTLLHSLLPTDSCQATE